MKCSYYTIILLIFCVSWMFNSCDYRWLGWHCDWLIILESKRTSRSRIVWLEAMLGELVNRCSCGEIMWTYHVAKTWAVTLLHRPSPSQILSFVQYICDRRTQFIVGLMYCISIWQQMWNVGFIVDKRNIAGLLHTDTTSESLVWYKIQCQKFGYTLYK